MDIIRAALPACEPGAPQILLPVDRRTLAKRRWHAAAEDGREFGFDLAAPLDDGIPFFRDGGVTYLIAQRPEAVLEIALATPAENARAGWLIGNLHFPLELAGPVIRVADDTALRAMLEREQIPFTKASRVFHPYRQAHLH
jgi:urease accessory protein